MNLHALKELDLSDGQVRVYSAILELGISTINRIQEKTGIERRNIYDILNKLIEKGFVSYTVEKGKRTYQSVHPNKIKEEIQRKQTGLSALEKELPEMVSLFNISKPDIRAEIFRGNEAIKALLTEALEHKQSYWIGGNSGVESTPLKNWFGHWMQKRVEKKHIMYDLVDYGTFLSGLKPHDIKKHKKEHYKYCALPRELKSPMVIIIFGNKVAQVLWKEQSFAFVLESKEIKESFMKYFHYFWKNPW
jgi:predicted transcriptional regulator